MSSLGSIPAGQTAIVLIEYQNEFASEGGGLHDAVKPEMERTSMLPNTIALVEAARKKNVKIIHAPITFADDYSDSPQHNFGILKSVVDGGLFKKSGWGGQIIDSLSPKPSDLVVTGKKGLCGFSGTDLESLLNDNGIKHVALGGFLTNCCVESTMRTAYEKRFNVFTLTDCTAATSKEEYDASLASTWGMCSQQVSSTEFLEKVE